jgi:Sigma-70 region 2
MLAANIGEEYLKNPTTDAFGRLVEHYVHVVYASARRQLSDAHLAEDVTQAVFILLSQKAKSIPADRPLAAWLLTTTRYVAANARREAANRQKHEREAAMNQAQAQQPEAQDKWNEISPLLDEGLAALGQSTAFQVSDIILPPNLPTRLIRIPGDIVYTNTLPIDKALAGLQTVMRRELELPVTLSLQDVDRKFFVLRGTFKFKRLNFVEPGNSPMPADDPTAPLIEVYGTDTFDPTDGIASGESISAQDFAGGISAAWFAQRVSDWIGNRKIINQADGFPGRIGWRGHVPRPGTGDADRIAHDPVRVLNHLAEQTGLTWAEETRRLSSIVVSIDK